jgi:hypothetical protein
MQIEVTKKKGIIAGGAILLLMLALVGGGYLAGRHFTPPNVVVQEKVRVQEVEKQVVVTKTETKTQVQVIRVHEKDNDIHRTVDIEKKPDGTTVTHVVVDDKSKTRTDTDVKKDQVATTDSKSETVREVVRVEEKTVTQYTPRLKWNAGVLVGYHLPGLAGDHVPNLIPGQDLVVGAVVQRHLAGPFSVGAWGTSTKDMGMSLHIEW